MYYYSPLIACNTGQELVVHNVETGDVHGFPCSPKLIRMDNSIVSKFGSRNTDTISWQLLSTVEL